MNADDYKPGEYGPLTPSPQGETPSPEEEEKKNKKSSNKKKALVGLAALLVAGGCCVGVGSCVRDRQAPPMPEETAVVVVDKREVAPTPTEYIVPVAPTPVPSDVREGWYGVYEGTATGRRESNVRNTIDVDEFFEGEELMWVEIFPPEYCSRFSYCTDRSWVLDLSFIGCENGIEYTDIQLFLPEDFSDALGLTITEDRLTIAPTEEHPYELVIQKVNGRLEGHLQTDWEGDSPPERWTVDYLTAERNSTEMLGGPLSCQP